MEKRPHTLLCTTTSRTLLMTSVDVGPANQLGTCDEALLQSALGSMPGVEAFRSQSMPDLAASIQTASSHHASLEAARHTGQQPAVAVSSLVRIPVDGGRTDLSKVVLGCSQRARNYHRRCGRRRAPRYCGMFSQVPGIAAQKTATHRLVWRACPSSAAPQ